MVELINHASNSIFIKNPIRRVFPNLVTYKDVSVIVNVIINGTYCPSLKIEPAKNVPLHGIPTLLFYTSYY